MKEKLPELKKSNRREEIRERNTGLAALYRKEMRDHIRSSRFLLILVLIVITSFASLYGALSNLSSAGSSSEFLFLSLFTTSGSAIPFNAPYWATASPLCPRWRVRHIGIRLLSTACRMLTISRLPPTGSAIAHNSRRAKNP